MYLRFFLSCFFMLFFTTSVHAQLQKDLVYNISEKELSSEFIPLDLVYFIDHGIKVTRGSNDKETQGREVMMDDLKELIDICEEQTGQEIYIRSGYRSHYLQQTTYAKYGKNYSVKAGKSEHQLGLGIDIETREYKAKVFMNKQNTAYQCFLEEAFKFGFIQTYVKGNPDGIKEEPWHWRYVSPYVAKKMQESDLLKSPWMLWEGDLLKTLLKTEKQKKQEAVLREKIRNQQLKIAEQEFYEKQKRIKKLKFLSEKARKEQERRQEKNKFKKTLEEIRQENSLWFTLLSDHES